MSRAVSFHFPIAGTVKKGCGGGGGLTSGNLKRHMVITVNIIRVSNN